MAQAGRSCNVDIVLLEDTPKKVDHQEVARESFRRLNASLRALSNKDLTRAAPLPTYISTKAEPDKAVKLSHMASPATARASSVSEVNDREMGCCEIFSVQRSKERLLVVITYYHFQVGHEVKRLAVDGHPWLCREMDSTGMRQVLSFPQ